MKTIDVLIIRTDGTEEVHQVSADDWVGAAEKLIDAECMDSVNLRDRRIMFVDDFGWETETVTEDNAVLPNGQVGFKMSLIPVRARKPINAKATALYRAVCRPGIVHQIAGDVAILRDDD